MLELKNVNKYYTANGITNLGLRNINLTFSKGEIVAITGDSGCGKSTLLNVITKLDNFDDGEIYYKGNETSYFSISDMDDFRKNKVGFIFQNYNIIDSYTVLENVMVPLLLKGISKKEAKEQALGLIEKVGLLDKIKNRGSKLSGGEKQRCVIARALASDCEILACDEPTGNLDSKTGAEIINLINEVAKDKLVLIVTHDYSIVEKIVTRKIKMNDGEIVEDQVFEKKETEPHVSLDLDYKPLSRKTNFELAKNNVLFTPKKTIFLSSIFFVISVIVLFLFQTIYSSNDFYYYNSYSNKQDNRLYVYNLDHSPIDISKIEQITTDYVINPFWEESTHYIECEETYDFMSVLYNRHVPKYSIKEGRLPQNDNEIFVVVPSGWSLYTCENLLNRTVYFELDKTIKFTLVGFGISSEIYEQTVIKNNLLEKLLYSPRVDATLKVANMRTYVETVVSETATKNTLILPENIDINTVSFSAYLHEIYEIKNYEIIYKSISTPKFEYSLNEYLTGPVYECSVYTNKIKETTKNLEAMGFFVDYPSKLDESFNAEVFLQNLSNYALMLFSSIMLIGVFYITYFILAKVYISKKKDYEILRTLGVTKRDMKKVVNYEVLFVGITTMIVAYIVVFICLLTVPHLSFLGLPTLTTSLIYFAVLILFVYAIGRRFNSKLFKFSVSKSLKGDDYFD